MSNEGASDFMTFAEVSANREWTANSFLALGDRKLRSVTSEMSRNGYRRCRFGGGKVTRRSLDSSGIIKIVLARGDLRRTSLPPTHMRLHAASSAIWRYEAG